MFKSWGLISAVVESIKLKRRVVFRIFIIEGRVTGVKVFLNRFDNQGILKISTKGNIKHENYGYGLALNSQGNPYITGASNWINEPFTPCIWTYFYGTLKLWREFGQNGTGQEIVFDSYDNLYVVGTAGNTNLMVAKFNKFGVREFVEYREDLHSGTDGFVDGQNKLFISGSKKNYFGTLDAYFLKLNFTLYPEGRSITINNGDISTDSQTVRLSISALNSDEMSFKSSTMSNWTQWEPYDSSATFNIESPINNTAYTIAVKFRNNYSETIPINDSIQYLVFPPLNPHITLNEGALNTSDPLVRILISISGADEMCFKESTSKSWGAWKPYRYWTDHFFISPVNYTVYTIMAKFRNDHGESKIVNASILFYIPLSLSIPLNPSIIINDGDYSFNSTILKLSLFAVNANEMRLKIGNSRSWKSWESYNSTKLVFINNIENNTSTISQ